MDLNIGAALWLAVSGKGRLHLPARPPPQTAAHQPPPQQAAPCDPADSNVSDSCDTCERACGSQPSSDGSPVYSEAAEHAHLEGAAFESAARVVLLGHGADEQCAGYGRHRTRYRWGGWPLLSDELALDVRRMWLRNCGRDDRLVADWGREARHPFLDEAFMACLLDLHLAFIAGEG